jgi:hypothetical protein
MAKTQETTTKPATVTQEATQPALGSVVTVVCPDGAVLRNNETGGLFEPGKPTDQVVTVTLLRRLADGDLILV